MNPYGYPSGHNGYLQPNACNVGLNNTKQQSFGMPQPQLAPQPGYPNQCYPQAVPPKSFGMPQPQLAPQPGYPNQCYPQAGLLQPCYAPQACSPGYAPNNEGAVEYPNPSHHHRSQVPQTFYPTEYATQCASYGNIIQAKKRKPMVLPFEPFNPRSDAKILRKAMKGFGTDEKSIIQLVTRRTNEQRTRIAFEYRKLYGKDLINKLKSEFSCNIEELIVGLMTPLPQFYAKEIHDAVDGIGTDQDVLIEILCTMSNSEIRIIQDAYKDMYQKPMVKDRIGDTSGYFKRLLVTLCTANRDENCTIDPMQAKQDAESLWKAGELRFGTNESAFNGVMCSRSWPQLAAMFNEYEIITGHSFEKAINDEFSGDIKNGLLAIVKVVRDRSGCFAELLHKSMKGLGTNDRQLIRIMVTRSEVDLGDIQAAFNKLYTEPLHKWIEEDCSGFYKKCLLALLQLY